jgi:hypothetical protein
MVGQVLHSISIISGTLSHLETLANTWIDIQAMQILYKGPGHLEIWVYVRVL